MGGGGNEESWGWPWNMIIRGMKENRSAAPGGDLSVICLGSFQFEQIALAETRPVF